MRAVPSRYRNVPFHGRIVPMRIRVCIYVLMEGIQSTLSMHRYVLSTTYYPFLFLITNIGIIRHASRVRPITMAMSRERVRAFYLCPTVVNMTSVTNASCN